jgi:hypothetical protein
VTASSAQTFSGSTWVRLKNLRKKKNALKSYSALMLSYANVSVEQQSDIE